jgi:3-hydroxyisobutyrate dehydrogenase-like beta-hydroxyacid dehydrogenase
MLKYRGPFVLEMPGRGFSDVAMMQKDLRLALALAQAVGVALPTTAVTQEMLTAARGLGRGAFDFAAVFDVVATISGLPESRKQPPGGDAAAS